MNMTRVTLTQYYRPMAISLANLNWATKGEMKDHHNRSGSHQAHAANGLFPQYSHIMMQ